MAKITPKAILAALKATAFRSVGATVDKGAQWQRMQTCADCPELKKPETLEEKTALLFSGGEYVCGICGCGVNLLITTHDELLPEETDEEAAERPSSCWFPKTHD